MDVPIQPGETQRFTVYGKTVPQGDLTAMPLLHRTTKQPIMKGGRPIINQVHSNAETLKPWRQEIAGVAIDSGWKAMGLNALDEAVHVWLTFFVKRPASHYGTGRNAGVLKDGSPLEPEQSGADVDKLSRAVLDALTGIVFKDDKRVTVMRSKRRYGSPERVEIKLRRPKVRTVGELRRLLDAGPVSIEADLQLGLLDVVGAFKPDQGKATAAASPL